MFLMGFSGLLSLSICGDDHKVIVTGELIPKNLLVLSLEGVWKCLAAGESLCSQEVSDLGRGVECVSVTRKKPNVCVW